MCGDLLERMTWAGIPQEQPQCQLDLPRCEAALAGRSRHRLAGDHEHVLILPASMLAASPKYNDTNVTKALICPSTLRAAVI